MEFNYTACQPEVNSGLKSCPDTQRDWSHGAAHFASCHSGHRNVETLSSEFRIRSVWFLQSGRERGGRQEADMELQFYRACAPLCCHIRAHLLSAGFLITSD